MRKFMSVVSILLIVCLVSGCAQGGGMGTQASDGWTVTKEATCTEDGAKEKVVNGETVRDRIPALGHAYGDWTVDVEAECESDGSRSRKCSRCNDIQEEAIPHIGHKMSSEKLYDKDNHYLKCEVCHAEFDKTEHDFELYDTQPLTIDLSIFGDYDVILDGGSTYVTGFNSVPNAPQPTLEFTTPYTGFGSDNSKYFIEYGRKIIYKCSDCDIEYSVCSVMKQVFYNNYTIIIMDYREDGLIDCITRGTTQTDEYNYKEEYAAKLVYYYNADNTIKLIKLYESEYEYSNRQDILFEYEYYDDNSYTLSKTIRYYLIDSDTEYGAEEYVNSQYDYKDGKLIHYYGERQNGTIYGTNTYSFEYHNNGIISKVIASTGTSWTNTYDEHGNFLYSDTAISYSYDYNADGTVSCKYKYNSDKLVNDYVYSYTYDDNGNLTYLEQVSTSYNIYGEGNPPSITAWEYTYNSDNLIVSTTRSYLNSLTGDMTTSEYSEYEYNEYGQLTKAQHNLSYLKSGEITYQTIETFR